MKTLQMTTFYHFWPELDPDFGITSPTMELLKQNFNSHLFSKIEINLVTIMWHQNVKIEKEVLDMTTFLHFLTQIRTKNRKKKNLIQNLHIWSFFQKNVLQLIRKTGTIFMSLKVKNREEIPENNHFLWFLTLVETKFRANIPKNEFFWINLNLNFISKTDERHQN